MPSSVVRKRLIAVKRSNRCLFDVCPFITSEPNEPARSARHSIFKDQAKAEETCSGFLRTKRCPLRGAARCRRRTRLFERRQRGGTPPWGTYCPKRSGTDLFGLRAVFENRMTCRIDRVPRERSRRTGKRQYESDDSTALAESRLPNNGAWHFGASSVPSSNWRV